jgi:hypothetical protein
MSGKADVMAIKHRIRVNGKSKKTMKLTAKWAIIEHCKECMGFMSTGVLLYCVHYILLGVLTYT